MGNDYLDLISNKKIAILDVNNFYVSCERLFQPAFKKIPSVVLSNNDGCIIARSQEVKDLGIKMGQPLFQLDADIKEGIKKFSSNYALYGDISDRIINVLKREVPMVEVYSIDEAFLDLSHIEIDKLEIELNRLKELIFKLIGVPVSIGVAPTKTLAKLTNFIAKKRPEYNNICSYWKVKDLLDDIDIDEVWGIGRQSNKKLRQLNINKVGDFKKMNSTVIRSVMHTPGVKTYMELHEVICNPITTKFKKPKMITTSRTFGSTVWEPEQLYNAIWTFTSNCHRKLVKEKLRVTACSLFATTNKFDENYYIFNYQFMFKWETDDLQIIWNQVAPILKSMPVRLYYKAGICFYGLKNKNSKQEVIFREDIEHQEIPHVEHVKWQTRREFLTPSYTTSWSDIPVLR